MALEDAHRLASRIADSLGLADAVIEESDRVGYYLFCDVDGHAFHVEVTEIAKGGLA